MPDLVRLDWAEWNRATLEYSAATRKTLADSQNRKMGDVALRASSFSPKADRSDIENIWQNKDWWPKLIQKVIHMEGGFNIHGRRKARGEEANADWIDLPTGKTMHGRRTVGYDRKATGSYADAVRVSKRIIRRRLATVGMFRAIFGVVSLAFGKHAGRIERKGRNWLVVEYATPGKLQAAFEIPFTKKGAGWPGGTRPSPSADVAKKVEMGYAILQRAIDFVTLDADEYTQRRLAEDARRFSAL